MGIDGAGARYIIDRILVGDYIITDRIGWVSESGRGGGGRVWLWSVLYGLVVLVLPRILHIQY